MDVNSKLAELGLDLPTPSAPAAAYVATMRAGNTLYVSGQLSIGPDGLVTGKLGDTMTTAQGIDCARFCALQLLAQVGAACGGFPEGLKALKLTGFIASAPGFTEQHLVMNGASDLVAHAMGAAGTHARAAVGVAELPLGAAVEVEGIFLVP